MAACRQENKMVLMIVCGLWDIKGISDRVIAFKN